MLEDKLHLTVRLKHNGALVKGADATRSLHPTEQVNRDAGSLLAGRIKEGILNILRRLIAIHSRSPLVIRLRPSICRPITAMGGLNATACSWKPSTATGTRGDIPPDLHFTGSQSQRVVACTIRRSAKVFNLKLPLNGARFDITAAARADFRSNSAQAGFPMLSRWRLRDPHSAHPVSGGDRCTNSLQL